MKTSCDVSKLKETAAWEHALRFVLGGAITAATGIVAHRFGPTIGGLFLAFPAILPASLTLVKRHDGRRCAVDDARGGVLGAFGLVAFAATILAFSAGGVAPSPALVLGVASLAWAASSVALWYVVYGRS